MKNYVKPMLVRNDELAEGIYLASGSVADFQGSVMGTVTSFDHYGNYYMRITGFENAATYNITLTVNETATVSGLNAASWGDFGGIVNGKTVSFEGICFNNQTDWHVRLWFDSQDNWELGWKLTDDDIPSLSISVTKV